MSKEISVRQKVFYHVPDLPKDQSLVQEDESLEQRFEITCFHQAYLKWTVDNLSEEFKNFQKRIASLVTLPQLLNSKEFVVDLLLESLKKASTLSLQPLLE